MLIIIVLSGSFVHSVILSIPHEPADNEDDS
jgi:hypothetical protein